ncbi:peptidase T [Carnobacterium sp. AT7]|uniref:peptidase T n=1 Tax=Carnobacterium sp. AT7 TaxID=333990 RepID=UPI00015F20DC|nr:peptidase T [Carnobacterium sp. AT7]EDP68286.1 peptidase T [Carnobacterium sp. AT7]
MDEQLLKRFVKYAKVNTRSDMNSQTVPTTYAQVEFALKLAEELKEIGLEEVEYNDANGFVTATLPSNLAHDVPVIGFIAHIDTADFNAENIQPQVHVNYDGNDIVLNKELGIVMTTAEFPQLAHYIGETVITTDGTTLLGADDKAGMASIVTAMEEFIQHPELPHGKIRVAFGPDEEIGRGALLFDVDQFQADFAYTLDSGRVGKFEYETFNAAQAELTIKGTSVHPGTAKDSMVNALLVAAQFATALPQKEVPEKTEGYEGFYMLSSQVGTIDEVKATYIIRDHDKAGFEKRKQHFAALVDQFNQTFDQPRIAMKLYDQYYNMRDIIEKDLSIVELALNAYRALGIEPDVKPFRGGTDGSIITYKGLPTPNIFTGAENLHGKYEFVSVEGMKQAAQVVIEIARMNAE